MIDGLTQEPVKTARRFARITIGTPGLVVRFIALDRGVGAATFQRLCNHPQQWFTDDKGVRIRATAIVTFAILTRAEYRKAIRNRK